MRTRSLVATVASLLVVAGFSLAAREPVHAMSQYQLDALAFCAHPSDSLISGSIQVVVNPGVDVNDVVRDHSGAPTDVSLSVSPPYDKDELAAGLARVFQVAVPTGRECELVSEYWRDSRVEFSGPNGKPVPLAG